jgi:3-hydroxyacyl-[acyl-carrier-protein] dehydratase
MPPPIHIDPTTIDLSRVVADRAAIRLVNAQRFAMEQLDAVVLIQPEEHLIVGYKDVRADEFWVPGHFPGQPIFPGVLMCEAGAQLGSYYAVTQKVIDLETQMLVFGGLDNVRFRGVVRPGDRLVLACKATRVKKRQSIFGIQGFVGSAMVFQGDVIGVPLDRARAAAGG